MPIEYISIIIAALSFIVAGGSLYMSFVTYRKYDRKIKEYQLRKIDQEKTAKIRIELIESNPELGLYVIKLSNKGTTDYNGFKFYLATSLKENINLEYNKAPRIFKSDSSFSVKIKTTPKTIVGLCIVSMDWYDPHLETMYNEINTVVLE